MGRMTALVGWQNADGLTSRAQADACASRSNYLTPPERFNHPLCFLRQPRKHTLPRLRKSKVHAISGPKPEINILYHLVILEKMQGTIIATAVF